MPHTARTHRRLAMHPVLLCALRRLPVQIASYPVRKYVSVVNIKNRIEGSTFTYLTSFHSSLQVKGRPTEPRIRRDVNIVYGSPTVCTYIYYSAQNIAAYE